jgi:capsular exopolysaccharide synthesis family protein
MESKDLKLQMIESGGLAQKASRDSLDFDFSSYLGTLRRHWVTTTSVFALTLAITFVSTLFLKPSYRAEGKLLFKVDRTQVLSGLTDEARELKPLVETQSPLSTQIEVITSKNLLTQVIHTLNLRNRKGELLEPEDLQENINVKIIGGTDVLQLSYENSSATQAAAVVNTLMQFYIENDIQASRSEASKARKFIAEQLPKTENTLRKAEIALLRFKTRNKVVDLQEEAKAAVTEIANLESRINATNSELGETSAKLSALQQKVGLNPQTAVLISKLSQSSEVQDILYELQKTTQQLAVGRGVFQDRHPVIVDLKAKQAALKALLRKHIQLAALGSKVPIQSDLLQNGDLQQSLVKDLLANEVQQRGASKRLTALSQALTTYQQRKSTLTGLELEQLELGRSVTAARSTYEALLGRLQELQVAENKNTSIARILDQALTPTKGLTYKKFLILGFGTLLGAFLATITVLFLGIRDRSLRSLKDIQKVFQYPLLGMIPYFDKKTASCSLLTKANIPVVPVRDAPNSLVSEIYRTIQANLKFFSSNQLLNTIVVTSSVPQEGKSLVSANLAAAMAQGGQRVLLIDADIRRPLQHQLWNLSNQIGLADVIEDDRIRLSELGMIIRPTTMNSLSLLTSGTLADYPTTLLNSNRMTSILNYLAVSYDFVVIDAPPILPFADASALGSIADGVLLVVRPGMVDPESAIATQEILERSGQNVLGLVVNGVDLREEPNAYFKYTKSYLPTTNDSDYRQTKSKAASIAYFLPGNTLSESNSNQELGEK